MVEAEETNQKDEVVATVAEKPTEVKEAALEEKKEVVEFVEPVEEKKEVAEPTDVVEEKK